MSEEFDEQSAENETTEEQSNASSGENSTSDAAGETPGADVNLTAGADAEGLAAGFDASALDPVEPGYEDEELNEFIRRALAPISDEFPCGESESAASSVVSQIETTGDRIHESLRDAFGEAVRDENMSSFDMSSSGRDAVELAEQIVDCLADKCKSLVLASYLPHMLLIGHGLPGFAAGLDIFGELVKRYSAWIYPHDKDKLANFLRRGVYVGNDDKVTDNYKLFLYLPITESNSLAYALLRNSRLKSANPDVDSRYANHAANSSSSFYVKLIGDFDQAIESARNANSALAELLGDPLFEIVSYSFLESIERMRSIVNNLATENCPGYPPVEVEEAPAAEGAAAGAVAAAAAPAAIPGEIANREQAIDMLRRIADFFYKTERHSPVSYRIRETIRWCKMDLPELLEELLSGDEGPLEELSKRVGYRGDRNDGESQEYHD